MGNHRFVVLLCMFVLCSLSVSLFWGMASNALLISIIVKSVLVCLFELMPSKTYCVRFDSNVFVECRDPSTCCVRASGTPGCIMFSIRRSGILDGEYSIAMGL